MSIHKVEVSRIEKFEQHPNADTLEIIKIRGYTCCVKKGQFKIGDLLAYIEPDYVVPDTPEFSFLGGHTRIKVKRLRGVYSEGLLVPAPAGAKEGDNVINEMGIARYVPPERGLTYGDAEKAPGDISIPVYDVESYRNFPNLIKEDENIVATEKIHGCNGRFLWRFDRMWCGSRQQWKKEGNNVWWKAIECNQWMIDFCKKYQNLAVYAEVYGHGVQNLQYGCKPGEYRLAVFDLLELETNQWLPHDDAKRIGVNFSIQFVPEVYRGKFDAKKLEELALENTIVNGNHCCEGIVFKVLPERYDHDFALKSKHEIMKLEKDGRVQLKLVSSRYLER